MGKGRLCSASAPVYFLSLFLAFSSLAIFFIKPRTIELLVDLLRMLLCLNFVEVGSSGGGCTWARVRVVDLCFLLRWGFSHIHGGR